MTGLDSGPDGPQPFAHLSAPNAALYRDVLRSFARAKERFIVHLRPEDVAAELRRDSDEQLAQGWTGSSNGATCPPLVCCNGRPSTATWDPPLATAMRDRAVRVEEDQVLTDLLTDLAPDGTVAR
ncbi:DUF2397 family protein [Actinomadura luteofluorescens]|uniref:DUF2397 family protein n=1 Tax=Actinomadura luteofluorescens TaxID=46163 RepID=UPI0030D2F5BD